MAEFPGPFSHRGPEMHYFQIAKERCYVVALRRILYNYSVWDLNSLSRYLNNEHPFLKASSAL